MSTVAEALAQAMQHHRAGDLARAEQIYRQVLQANPAEAAALHGLGMLAHQAGRHDLAVDLIRQAATLLPRAAEIHANLARVYIALGRWSDAAASSEQALRIRPDLPEAHKHLAAALAGQQRWEQAIACYRHALSLRPTYAEAHHGLGVALLEGGEMERGVANLREAVRLRPENIDFLNSLGIALARQGQLADAEAHFREALRLRPASPEALINLGTVLRTQGRLAEAETCFREALRLRPDFAEASCSLGTVLALQQKMEQALACFEHAAMLKPDYVEVLALRGRVLKHLGRLSEAEISYRQTLAVQHNLPEVCFELAEVRMAQGNAAEALTFYEQAVRLDPDYADAWLARGIALAERGRPVDAEASLRQVLRLRPDSAGAINCLGAALADQGKFEEALASFQSALRLQPDFSDALCNYAVALTKQGRLDEALDATRRALQLCPQSANIHSAYFYFLHFAFADDREMLAREADRWHERHELPLEKLRRPHTNRRDPERRLRVGYVSPDLRWHPVGRFLLPLLQCHDRASFEAFCYSSVLVPDQVTKTLRDGADCWLDVANLNDEKLAEQIRQDEIDILVDLSAHTGSNRLLLFARKPAPVQVTFLAYCSTTGLRAIDYRLSDPFMDVPGEPTACYSEETVWLPETYFCFPPEQVLTPVSPLPAHSAGHVTFGCLNNLLKVKQSTLAVWGRLLDSVAGSHLLLYASPSPRREEIRSFLAQQGIAPERVEYVGYVGQAKYFPLYDRIDIALDPFPYTGGTTTCDALWMGVPVVSLVGPAPVCRMGLSILSNVGLPELAVANPEEYIRRASELAGDLERLAALRASLRERMIASPLTDAPRYARNVEAAFRTMWRRCC